jgi:hypothetical protein
MSVGGSCFWLGSGRSAFAADEQLGNYRALMPVILALQEPRDEVVIRRRRPGFDQHVEFEIARDRVERAHPRRIACEHGRHEQNRVGANTRASTI